MLQEVKKSNEKWKRRDERLAAFRAKCKTGGASAKESMALVAPPPARTQTTTKTAAATAPAPKVQARRGRSVPRMSLGGGGADEGKKTASRTRGTSGTEAEEVDACLKFILRDGSARGGASCDVEEKEEASAMALLDEVLKPSEGQTAESQVLLYESDQETDTFSFGGDHNGEGEKGSSFTQSLGFNFGFGVSMDTTSVERTPKATAHGSKRRSKLSEATTLTSFTISCTPPVIRKPSYAQTPVKLHAAGRRPGSTSLAVKVFMLVMVSELLNPFSLSPCLFLCGISPLSCSARNSKVMWAVAFAALGMPAFVFPEDAVASEHRTNMTCPITGSDKFDIQESLTTYFHSIRS